MASLLPFRALRPAPAVAAKVAAVPYDVVNTDEARALAAGNALSFLHVSRAEIDLPPDSSPYSDEVYVTAVRNLNRLVAEAPLVVEEKPSLYLYRIRAGAHEQTGIAGCYSLDEYEREVIKKHEKTRPDKEDDRTRHMIELRAQTGPVFLTYRSSATVDRIADRATAAQPFLFDFTAADGVRHSLWRVDPSLEADLIGAFGEVPVLYIADGHHRVASAARARQRLRGSGGASGAWDTFLAVAFPASQVRILPYNRLVKDLAGRSVDSVLTSIRDQVVVSSGAAPPARPGEVAMFLGGRWHTIILGEPSKERALADRLDVSLLQDRILAPIFGIGDPRSDKRIEFVGGNRPASEMEALVTSGIAAAAFSMYPASIGDLMAIADAGGIMPPKSTWFDPKLRDGLLSHVI